MKETENFSTETCCTKVLLVYMSTCIHWFNMFVTALKFVLILVVWPLKSLDFSPQRILDVAHCKMESIVPIYIKKFY